jgi:DNA repair exonuclease SbcCD ATPase subunit
LQPEVTLHKNGENISGKTYKDTNNMIKEIIGKRDEFMMQCIMEQKNSISFLDLSDIDKTRMICDVLKLNVYEKVQTEFEKCNNEMAREIKENNKIIYDNVDKKSGCRMDNVENEINIVKEEIVENRTDEDKLNEKYEVVNKDKIEHEMKLSELDKIDFSSMETDDIGEDNEENRNKLQKMKDECNDLDKKYKANIKSLEQYKNMNKKKSTFDAFKGKKIGKITAEINRLWKRYVKVEKSDIDIKQSRKNKKILEDEKNNILTEITELNDKIKKIQGNIRSYQCDKDNILGYEKYLEYVRNCKENEVKKQIIQDKMHKMKSKYDDVMSEYEKINKEKDETTHQLKECANKIKNDKNSEVNEKWERVLKLIKLTQNKLRKSDINKKEIDTYNEKIREIYFEPIKLTESQREYDNICERIKELDNDINDYKNIIQKWENEQNELNKIEDEISCVNTEYEPFLECNERFNKNAENESKLKEYTNEIDKKILKRDKIGIEIDKVTRDMDEYKKYKENAKNNQEIKDEIDGMKEKIDNINNEVCEGYDEYMEINFEIEATEKKLSKLKIRIKEMEIKIMKNDEIVQKNRKMHKQYDTYTKLKQEIIDINVLHNKIKESLRENRYKGEELLKRLNELKAEEKKIKEVQDRNKKLNEDRDNNSTIISVIRDGFVDNMLSNKIIPNFCNSVNNILTSFVNYSVNMQYHKKKISVNKKDKNGLLSSALKLSGYETLMANIAFRLAINSINNQFKTNFFIVDEAFSFCDENSIKKIEYLFEYMRKRYDFVIVVSHNERIKKYADIDIPIQEKDECSYINMSK